MVSYDESYRRWREDPEGSWREHAPAFDCERAPRRILGDSRAPVYCWFPHGVLNAYHNRRER